MLPRPHRLRKNRDFSAVYRKKRSFGDAFLVLYLLRRSELSGTSRLGFAVSKKVGKAHDRNRLKRRLRALCAEHFVGARGFDVIVVGRVGSASADFATLSASIHELLRRAGIVSAPKSGEPGASA